MINKPFDSSIKIIFSLVLLACLSVHAHASDIIGPKAVVENAVTNIVITLEAREDKSMLTPQNRQEIRHHIDQVFDYRIMSKYSLGKEWKHLNEASRTTFTGVFRSLVERSYSNRLSAYHGQEISFSEPTFKKGKKGQKAYIKSFVIDTNKTTPIEYRLHHKNNLWRVYDIRIEGVSLIRTFRDDFKSTLKKKGFDGLLSALQKRVARLKEKEEH